MVFPVHGCPVRTRDGMVDVDVRGMIVGVDWYFSRFYRGSSGSK